MFGEGEMELLTLSSALDPKSGYKSFKIDDISSLVEKYYPLHFSKQEKLICHINWSILNLMYLIIRNYKICLLLGNYVKG